MQRDHVPFGSDFTSDLSASVPCNIGWAVKGYSMCHGNLATIIPYSKMYQYIVSDLKNCKCFACLIRTYWVIFCS